MTTLFFWLGTTGGFGVLLLLAVTSVAVVVYFARHRSFEPVWQRAVAPTVAAALLTAMAWLVVHNYPTLLGVAPGSLAARVLPLVFLVAAVAGVGWGLLLRATRPEVYQSIGLGADAVTGRDKPIVTAATHRSQVTL
jgi:peptidoglycan biosynthesis protein MviN/MurJ (putative lipid II flippase)